MIKRLTYFCFISLFFICTPITKGFSDVQENHPHFHAINYLEKNSIIQGYSDGSFQADKPISRAELLKIGLLSNGHIISSQTSAPAFLDVKDNEWFYQFLSYAKINGIVNGYPDGTFRPHNQVNAVEAMKMLIEMGSLSVDKDTKTDEEWFMPYVHLLDTYQLRKNLIQEYDKVLNRGEVAELMFRIMSISHFNALSVEDLVYRINNDSRFENLLSFVFARGYTHIISATQKTADNQSHTLFRLTPYQNKNAFILQFYDTAHKIDFYVLIEYYEEEENAWLHFADAKSEYRMRISSKKPTIDNEESEVSFIPQTFSNSMQFSLEPYGTDYNDALSTFSYGTDFIYSGISDLILNYRIQRASHYQCKTKHLFNEGCIAHIFFQNGNFWNNLCRAGRERSLAGAKDCGTTEYRNTIPKRQW